MFLLLQVGVLLSAGVALAIDPSAWRGIGICALGALLASLVCERFARRYLHRTLGRLRRVADDVGRGRTTATMQVHPGDDFYKLVSAVNLMATRLAEASAEEKRLHEELRRRERLAFLGELAATVAHEVNNPLDGIQNCARILRRSSDDPRRTEQMLDLMDDGLRRIELIVRRLLTLAREHVIRPVDVALHDIVESAVAAVATRLDERRVRLTRRFDACDDRASADPQLLEQVFVNLLLNAADSMPHGGELVLSIRRDDGRDDADGPPAARHARLCVTVADSGTGIAPDVRPHIFEPFYTTKTRGKGTGLGLPIAARIVDAHGGSIDVAPREEGGTEFIVCIPAVTARRGAKVQSDPRAADEPVSARS